MLAEPQPGPSKEPATVCVAQQQQSGLRKLFDSIWKAAFVLGTALLVFICASNTITWYVQRFWGASGDFWQRQWASWYHRFGGNPFYLTVFGSAVVANVAFWGLNSILLFVDVTGWPKTLISYKVQADQNVPLKREDLWRAVKVASFNQFVVGFPAMVVAYYIMQWRGCDFGLQMPTFQRVLIELVAFSLIEEVCFYYSHRLLHHPRLYKHIHKRHHEWTAPIGLVAIYAHPIEHVVSNLLGPLLGPIIMGSHIATGWLWFCLALISTTIAHCGYHFPFLPSPEAHDYHHLKFNNNFGVLGVLDRLHGTDESFRASKQYQRHFLLLSLVPVSQQYPDNPKQKPQKSE